MLTPSIGPSTYLTDSPVSLWGRLRSVKNGGVTTSPKPRQYAGQSPAERVSERRERLVRATLTLVAAHGESAATMTKICAEAGLTERYYYESFAKRDEVLVAALNLAATEIADAALLAISRTDGDGDNGGQRVRAGIAAVIDLAVADPTPVRMVLLESAGNAALRARRHELMSWFADLVAGEADTILAGATWPAPRARLQGMVFVAGYAELIGFWLLGEHDLTPQALTDLGVELFEVLLRRP